MMLYQLQKILRWGLCMVDWKGRGVVAHSLFESGVPDVSWKKWSKPQKSQNLPYYSRCWKFSLLLSEVCLRLALIPLLLGKVSKRQILTEENLDETDTRLEHSSQKSLRCCARETRVSNFKFWLYSFSKKITWTCECIFFMEVPGMHAKQQSNFSICCNSSKFYMSCLRW
jgi:hypothetical protein